MGARSSSIWRILFVCGGGEEEDLSGNLNTGEVSKFGVIYVARGQGVRHSSLRQAPP